MPPFIRLENSDLGLRLYVLGRRIHEAHAGLAGLVVALLAAAAEVGAVPVALLAALSMWMVVKDWRDLHPATRDTASWRLGMHRRHGAPAHGWRGQLPSVAALATAAVGLVNVIGALSPNAASRLRLVDEVVSRSDMHAAGAIALPLGLALFVAAAQLARGRRGAAIGAVTLLALLGAADLLDGFQLEATAVTWTLALGLFRVRHAFWVAPPARVSARAWLLFCAAAAVLGLAATFDETPRLALLCALAGASLLWLASTAALVPELQGEEEDRGAELRRAATLIRTHGADTLSSFKLRRDLVHRFHADGRALVGYKEVSGALLMSGDPVGTPADLAAALSEARQDARDHGLVFGVVGASERCTEAGHAIGLSRMYLGDEAILDTGPMDLRGRGNASLRKAVNRVAREGYTAELHTVGDLDNATVAELRAVSDRWRDGQDERGFCMAHDALVDILLPDALVVLARHEDGHIGGFLHFAPVFGRPAASLGFMRRDRDTPNGLTDFLVVRSAELLGQRGTEEFSLNFAAFARWLRAPENLAETLLAKLLRVGDRWFQVERLHRYNAKFHPRWQPRYLLFEKPSCLPRILLAAMQAEGQLPSGPRITRPAEEPA